LHALPKLICDVCGTDDLPSELWRGVPRRDSKTLATDNQPRMALEKKMRTVIVGMFAAIGIGFAALPSAAGPLGNARTAAPEARLVEQVQMSSYCRRLRRACTYKDERGEVGEGNCRRYRRECGRW
jgi:hypothetical protein